MVSFLSTRCKVCNEMDSLPFANKASLSKWSFVFVGLPSELVEDPKWLCCVADILELHSHTQEAAEIRRLAASTGTPVPENHFCE